jgi:hypothetical protein
LAFYGVFLVINLYIPAVVFVINRHDEIIHFGHFHTIFGNLKCQISIFNSFSIKKKIEKKFEKKFEFFFG